MQKIPKKSQEISRFQTAVISTLANVIKMNNVSCAQRWLTRIEICHNEIIIVTFAASTPARQAGHYAIHTTKNKNRGLWCIFKQCLSHKLAWLVCIMSCSLLLFNREVSSLAGISLSHHKINPPDSPFSSCRMTKKASYQKQWIQVSPSESWLWSES